MSTSSARPGSIGRRSLLTGLGVAGSGFALATAEVPAPAPRGAAVMPAAGPTAAAVR